MSKKDSPGHDPHVLGTIRQDEAIQWTLELRRAARGVVKALTIQRQIRDRPLDEVVRGQLAMAMTSSGSDLDRDSISTNQALQNVTQDQRNVALLGLKDRVQTAANPNARKSRLRALSSILNGQISGGLTGEYDDDDDDGVHVPRARAATRYQKGKEVYDQATYTRKHFFVNDRGNYYYFWGRFRVR